MPTVVRTAEVAYSAAQMFTLVNDIEAYPDFLHWCRGARVSHRSDSEVEATLDVGFGGIHKSFSTRNTLAAPHSIHLELISGPFRSLNGQWTFRDLEDGGCRVALSLSFEVPRSPFGLIFSRVFEEIARSQMGAFLRRAKAVYG